MIKRIIFIGFILGLLASCDSDMGDDAFQTSPTISGFSGIGYVALKMEDSLILGFADESYAVLDEILYHAHSGIDKKARYNYDEAVEVLSLIGEMILEVKSKANGQSGPLFSTSLMSKENTEYSMACTYLTIGKELDLPLNAALGLNSIHIIWNSGDQHILWNTVKNEPVDHSVGEDISTDNGIFRVLSPFEMEAVVNYHLSLGLDSKRAIEYLTKSVKILPSYLMAHERLAEEKFSIKDFEGAKEDWARVVHLDKDYQDFDMFIGMASIKYKDKSYDEVMDLLAKAISMKEEDKDVYMLRAMTEYELGLKEAAVSDYNHVIELDSNNAEAYFGKGMIEFADADYQRSIEDLEKALKNGKKGYTVLHSIGVAKAVTKDFEGANVYFTEILDHDPQNGKVLCERALCKIALNDKEGGCDDLMQSLHQGHRDAEQYLDQTGCASNI